MPPTILFKPLLNWGLPEGAAETKRDRFSFSPTSCFVKIKSKCYTYQTFRVRFDCLPTVETTRRHKIKVFMLICP